MKMESLRAAYKKDDFGNDIFARVSWVQSDAPKAIAIAYHGGGLLVGSSEIIPKTQTEYLATHGFVVVAPNYRLCPQVKAKNCVADSEEAHDWIVSTLPGLLSAKGQKIDISKIVAFGHSSGGTLAMHLAAVKNIAACTAFYPTLSASDPTASGHQPWTLPPYLAGAGDFVPTEEDWKSITPAGVQLSEAPLPVPGQVPPPRNRWQVSLAKKGDWLKTICPEGDFDIIDPVSKAGSDMSPVMIVQGDADDAPGSSLELATRAEKELKAAGAKEVELDVVGGAGHMFDMALSEGGAGWQSVVKGLDWLSSHV